MLLPGMTRDYQKTRKSFQSTFSDYDVDLYGSIWDVHGGIRGDKNYGADPKTKFSKDSVDLTAIGNAYYFRHFRVESWDDWLAEREEMIEETCKTNGGLRRHMYAHGILGQYYQVQQCFDLIPDPSEYEVIVRWRFDIEVGESPSFLKEGGGISFSQPLHDSEALSDCYFFGPPDLMREACHLYDYALDPPELDLSAHTSRHKTTTPEVLMHHLLTGKNLPFRTTGIRAKIIR